MGQAPKEVENFTYLSKYEVLDNVKSPADTSGDPYNVSKLSTSSTNSRHERTVLHNLQSKGPITPRLIKNVGPSE